MGTPQPLDPTAPGDRLERLYLGVREQTRNLAAGLSDADATVQSMPDASPAKWHLAHTTLVLRDDGADARICPGYRAFDRRFSFLFNSYYESIGERHAAAAARTADPADAGGGARVSGSRRRGACATASRRSDRRSARSSSNSGCHHEQQHQELLLTDILHLFAQNPLRPAYQELCAAAGRWAASAAGIYLLRGRRASNWAPGRRASPSTARRPRHRVCMRSATAWRDRWSPTANGWTSLPTADTATRCCGSRTAGTRCSAEAWSRAAVLGSARRRILAACHAARRAAAWTPMRRSTHVSYFEADAFATLGRQAPADRSGMGGGRARRCRRRAISPTRTAAAAAASPARPDGGLRQMFGDVWEWTRSAFMPYPGFRAAGRARWANTTASSCPDSSCCAAAPASRRPTICAPAIAIFSARMRAGSSRVSVWPRMHNPWK